MYISGSDKRVFIIWNDGAKWNIDNSLTFTDGGVIYSTTITFNDVMYVYAGIGYSKGVLIYYDIANNKWMLSAVLDKYQYGHICTMTIDG